MRFPDRLRLPLTFDPGRLQADLSALASVEWTAHFVTRNYEGDWSAIALRAPKGETHPIRMIYADPTAAVFVDTPALQASAYFGEVLAAFQCPVNSARLMRLTPGSVIKEHQDHDLCADLGQARIHVPITTHPDVAFEVNRRVVPMLPGEAWYLRLSDPHRVTNRSDCDRVHLVIDVVVDAWFEAQLVQGSQALAATEAV